MGLFVYIFCIMYKCTCMPGFSVAQSLHDANYLCMTLLIYMGHTDVFIQTFTQINIYMYVCICINVCRCDRKNALS